MKMRIGTSACIATAMMLAACTAPVGGVAPPPVDPATLKPVAGFNPNNLPGISGGDALALHTRVCGNGANNFEGWGRRLGDITKVVVASSGTAYGIDREYSFNVEGGECSMVFGMIPGTSVEVLEGLAHMGTYEPTLSRAGKTVVYRMSNGTLIAYRWTGATEHGKQLMGLTSISKSAQ